MSEEKELLEPPLESDFVDEFAEFKGAAPVTRRRRFGRRPSLFGPLLLIGGGLVLLLDQFGYSVNVISGNCIILPTRFY